MTNSGVRARLPEPFVERVRALLGAETERFLSSFDEPRSRGVRVNPTKVAAEDLRRLLGLRLDQLPWCVSGFALPDGEALGGHPAHLAGLYYLQEPSAMSVVEALDPQPGWRVADLAAAPGGKTTHLASRVGEHGLVVANDVNRKRLRALHDNLDLWGMNNVITTTRPIGQLARSEGEGFDGVVLDAPCTGEALFRRDPNAIRQWSPASVDGAARRQGELLADAAALVRPGGILVYSTCSFGIAENEQQVVDFLASTNHWTLEDSAHRLGAGPGVSLGSMATELTARLWPHQVPGEGQFVARLRRESTAPRGNRSSLDVAPSSRRRTSTRTTVRPEQVLDGWARFRRLALWAHDFDTARIVVRGDRAFLTPRCAPPLERLDVARPGLPLGRLRPGRFVPNPALAAFLRRRDAMETVSWTQRDPELGAYLQGETVANDGPDGWVLVCFHEWGVAWAHRTQGRLKNHVPPHLRRQAAAYVRRMAPTT